MTNDQINAAIHEHVEGKCVHENIERTADSKIEGLDNLRCVGCNDGWMIKSTESDYTIAIKDYLSDPAYVLAALDELMRNGACPCGTVDGKNIHIVYDREPNPWEVCEPTTPRAVLLAVLKKEGVNIVS